MIKEATLSKVLFPFFYWICIFGLLPLNAQKLYYQNFGIKDGLPSTEFYDVYQTPNSYTWFSSDRGIVRYNGYEFEVFSLEDGLSNLVNFTFFPDHSNTFWVNGLDGSFSFWDGQKFIPFQYNKQLIELAKEENIWFQISEIDEKYIYFFAANNPFFKGFRIDQITGDIVNLDVEDFPISTKCSSITKKAFIWLDKYSNRFNNDINKYIFLAKEPIKLPYRPEIPIINNELLTEENDLFLMTNKGLFIYPEADYYQTPKRLLPEFGITSAAIQADGKMWVTSNTNGLFFIPSTEIQSIVFPPKENNNFTSIFPGNGFLMAKNFQGKVFTLKKDLSIASKVYQSYKNLFLYHKDPFDSTAFHFGGMSFKSGKLISEENHSTLHFRFRENLYLNHGYYMLSISKKIDQGLAHKFFSVQNRTFCAKTNERGDLLIGTLNGLIQISAENIEQENLNLEYVPLLKNIRINDLIPLKTGVWLATLGHGLVFWDGERLQKIKSPQISSSTIHSLFLQNDSTLWVGTNKGLNRIHYQIDDKKVQISNLKKITTSNGISSNYIKDIEGWEGKIWLATDNGLCYFDPTILEKEITIPKIYLDQFVVNGTSIQLSDSTLELSHEQNDIQILYTGISLDKPINDHFFYRYHIQSQEEIEEQTVDWIYTNNRNIELYNMPSGDYYFWVQCRNIDDQWSNLLPVHFSILPHFTQTWWFRTLVALGLTLLFIFIWNNRSKRLEDRISLDLRLKTAELKTLRNQMNPHFVFNSLNAIQNYIFKGNPEEANLYIHSFSRLMRKSLQFSRLEKISISQEINFIEEYLVLEKMRFRDKFEFSIDASEIKYPEQNTIPALLIQPVVENAVKHAFKNFSGTGNIDISYQPHPTLKAIIVMVSDNGVGIDQSTKNKSSKTEHQSLGLQIIRQRLDLFNEQLGQTIGKLTFVDKKEPGTTIEIILPIFES